MSTPPLRILAIMAHPDDCEITIGGTAALWARAGHRVRFVSATNGETGHFEQAGATLTRRRQAEAAAAAAVLGVENQVLAIPTGQLEPTLHYRRMFITLIRQFSPDLIITHRPNDYHPDHRYTSQLVADSSYLVRVPHNTPETPPLRHNPVVVYCRDEFVKPTPFSPDVVIDIDATIALKLDAMDRHVSQMYEWIPWSEARLEQAPADPVARRAWLEQWRRPKDERLAERFRERLIARYGPARGAAVRCAEAFEACEYGAKLDAAAAERLFGGL